MDTEGLLSPASAQEAREWYDGVGPAAQEVVKETARAIAFDAAEYDERVTGEVIETARDALFASLLEVTVGTREEYEDWRADTDYDVVEIGNENVDNVVWHVPGFGDEAVAATYQDERRAAVSTLRRQAFGRIYREVV